MPKIQLSKYKNVILGFAGLLMGLILAAIVFVALTDESPADEVKDYFEGMQTWSESSDPLWVYGVAYLEGGYVPPQREVVASACYYVVSISPEVETAKIEEIISQLYSEYGYSYIYLLTNNAELSSDLSAKLCIKADNFQPSVLGSHSGLVEIEQVDKVFDPRRIQVSNYFIPPVQEDPILGTVWAVSFYSEPQSTQVLLYKFTLRYFSREFGRKDWFITNVEVQGNVIPIAAGSETTIKKMYSTLNQNDAEGKIVAPPQSDQRALVAMVTGVGTSIIIWYVGIKLWRWFKPDQDLS